MPRFLESDSALPKSGIPESASDFSATVGGLCHAAERSVRSGERVMMTHEDFLTRRGAGTIAAGIDNSIAMRLIDRLPRRYQAAHTFWSWVWMLSIPGFIAVAILVKWWVGLLLLVFVTPMISASVKQSAAQFVLEHATEDREFFEALVSNNLLSFRESPQPADTPNRP